MKSYYITITVIGLVMSLTYVILMIKVMKRWHIKMMRYREEARKEVEYLEGLLNYHTENVSNENMGTRWWLDNEIRRIKSEWQLEERRILCLQNKI